MAWVKLYMRITVYLIIIINHIGIINLVYPHRAIYIQSLKLFYIMIKECNMIIKIIVILLILPIAFAILSLIVYNNDVKKRMKNRRSIESIIIDSKTIEGRNVNNEIFLENKITMINIWGTYCSSCIKELPYLQEIHDEFKSKGVGIIGVIIDVNNEDTKDKEFIKAKKILNENNIKYPNVLLDDKFKASTTGAVFLIPTTIFVDSKGTIIGNIIETAYSKEEYTIIIQEYLKNKERDFSNNTNPIMKEEDLQHVENSYCTIDGKCYVKRENNK